MQTRHEKISVLVISRDRRDLLNRVISDLKLQDFQAGFEIVVVEETDNPQAPEGVIYVPHPMKNLGIAYARNLSLEHASHDILVFIDDDCRVKSDWLTQLVAPLANQGVLGVQGGVTVPEGTNAIGWAESLLGFPGGGITRIYQSEGEVQKTVEVSTLNACYRKEAVVKAGGFSDGARFGGEDYLLAKRVAEQGTLLFVPQAQVKHEARGTFSGIWTWFMRRGTAEFSLLNQGLASQSFALWMLRSSLSLKLLPFLLLSIWSFIPLLMMISLIVTVNLWRYRWALAAKEIPFVSWLLLPWVRVTMNLAMDAGRMKAWWYKL